MFIFNKGQNTNVPKFTASERTLIQNLVCNLSCSSERTGNLMDAKDSVRFRK